LLHSNTSGVDVFPGNLVIVQSSNGKKTVAQVSATSSSSSSILSPSSISISLTSTKPEEKKTIDDTCGISKEIAQELGITFEENDIVQVSSFNESIIASAVTVRPLQDVITF